MSETIIVAEIGCNHQGSVSIAKEMVAEAKRCGCNYVKFQKRDLASIPKELAKNNYTGPNSFGTTYLEHREALEFDLRQWIELSDHAYNVGIGLFGTAFDLVSASFLEQLECDFVKIGSMQCMDFGFIEAVSKLNFYRLIVSSGMCDSSDLYVLKDELAHLNKKHWLIHSTSSYPCPEEEVNLAALKSLSYGFDGLSGHYTSGNGAIEAAAVMAGAKYIERHFTLDRSWKGTDQAASLEPSGMERVVKAIRTVERAMGDGIKEIMPSELPIIEKLKCRAKNDSLR